MRDLVSYNSAISNSGFGALTDASSNLYAGRWLDNTTGNIRTMPRPSDKFFDPFDKGAKLGYLEALVLYYWDEMLLTYD